MLWGQKKKNMNKANYKLSYWYNRIEFGEKSDICEIQNTTHLMFLRVIPSKTNYRVLKLLSQFSLLCKFLSSSCFSVFLSYFLIAFTGLIEKMPSYCLDSPLISYCNLSMVAMSWLPEIIYCPSQELALFPKHICIK